MKAIIAYIPALHKRYIDFFNLSPGEKIFVIGKDMLKEFPRIERDLRALDPQDAASLLAGLGRDADVADEEKIKAITDAVMPDDELSHWFAEKYLSGKQIEFVPVFLRWDRVISQKEFEVPPDRIISKEEFDKEVMRQAVEISKKSPDWWRQIGAIAIKDGKATISAYNRPLPDEYVWDELGDPRSNFDAGERIDLSKILHAEAGVVAEAARRGISLEGASLYVTTFPCPVCAKSVAAAGIKKVYYSKGYSLLDAEEILKAFGVEIILVK